MSAIIKLDGYDLYPYLRVAGDEGFDPVDPNFLNPSFGDTAGEGAPLVSIKEDNREIVIPVHVNPAKDANFANTKDGLHRLIQYLEQRCQVATVLEWRDEGATSSTFLDVLAARFEPEYNFRRAQKTWMSGTIRVWTRPYASSGTFVLSATGAATGVAAVAALPTVMGDRPANLVVGVRCGSSLAGDGRIVGIAAVPSGQAWDFSASAIWSPLGAFLATGATGAIGSSFIKVTDGEVGRIYLTPASMYAGPRRVLAVARGGGQYRYWAEDMNGNRLAPNFAASVGHLGFGLLDLGVIDVDPSPGQATAAVVIKALQDQSFTKYPFFDVSGADDQLSRVMLLPDDSLSLVVDTGRRAIACDIFAGVDGPMHTVDQYGNVWSTATVVGFNLGFQIVSSDIVIASTASTGLLSAGMRIGSPTVADMKVEALYTTIGFAASNAIIAGKVTRAGGAWAQLHNVANSGARALSLWSGGVLTASVGLPSISNNGGLIFGSKGDMSYAEVWYNGSLCASIAGSRAFTSYDGQPFVALNAPAGTTPHVNSVRATEVPSLSIAPRDNYSFTPSGVFRWTAASEFAGRVTPIGNKTQASPGPGNQVVAFELPIDGGPAHLISTEVRVSERFTYSK